MRGHHELLRRFQQESGREYSTSDLVETLYPQQWRAIRQNQAFGDSRAQRVAQIEKTKLHRKALYHIGQLVAQGLLTVVRLDSHGEKCYQVALQYATVNSAVGAVTIEQKALNLPMITGDLENGTSFLFEQHSALSRFEACYLHGARLDGIGQLLHYAEHALRATSDMLAIGGLTRMLARYRAEDLREFVHALAMQTLDEGRSIVFILDVAYAGDRALALTLSETQPARIQAILNCSASSLRDPAAQQVLEAFRLRLGKLTVSSTLPNNPPVFFGRAGPYCVPKESWKLVCDGQVPSVVVSRASITLDLSSMKSAHANDVVALVNRSTKALFSMAAQQRLAGTGMTALENITPNSALTIQNSALIVRVWNYDWESPPSFLAQIGPTLAAGVAAHSHVYRACGMPLRPSIACSTAFAKYHASLSGRNYRKWTIGSDQDLHRPEFALYREARARITRELGGIDRVRIFRTGSPTSSQVAAELMWLTAAGFPLVTYEFKAISGVRTLKEFFVGAQ